MCSLTMCTVGLDSPIFLKDLYCQSLLFTVIAVSLEVHATVHNYAFLPRNAL